MRIEGAAVQLPRNILRVVYATGLAAMIACGCGIGFGSKKNNNNDDGGARKDGDVDAIVWPDAAACATGNDEILPTPVDIIIAIDQSASMIEERDAVRQNINANLTSILDASGIDYRVILIHGNFCMDPPLGDPNDCYGSNLPTYFRSDHDVNSSDALTVILWSFEGYVKSANTCDRVSNPAVMWSDKLRYEAFKVFIAVTDDDPSSFDCAYATATCTDNCSGCANNCSGYCPRHHCPTYADSPAAWGGGDFPTELYNLPGNMFGTAQEPRWIFHSIVGVDQLYQPNDPVTSLNNVCAYAGNTAETSGVEYQKLSVLTGGLRFPSCDTDYSPVFNQIANTIIPLACEFSVESTNVGEIDPNETNVEFDPQDGSTPVTFLRDNTAPCDNGANGWQWNADFTRILLCGDACDLVKSHPQGKVTITVGCTTLIR